MKTTLENKSTLDEIRARFDADVERFSNLETAQAAVIDAPLMMELITRAAISATPEITRVLDIGCGAGNNTIKLLRVSGKAFDCHLCDLSRPMLERARERVSAETAGAVELFEGDFRTLDLAEGSYDVVIGAAVFHHLRDDADWLAGFSKVYRLLRPGGSLWISDMVTHAVPAVDEMMWGRYAEYLKGLGGEEYAEKVFAYIDKEDSPRPLTYQLELLRRVGFRTVEVLHKNFSVAAFGAVK